MRKQLYLVIFLHFFFHLNPSFAQQVNFNLSHLTIDDGLADNYCHAVYMDKKGYIWFATQDGLSRYNGSSFTNYRYNDQDSTSILGHVMMDLIEDKEGFLWIASNGGGLNRFDPKTETFKSYDFYTSDNTPLFSYAATYLFIDSDDNLWIGTYDRGLCLLDKEKEKIIAFNLTEDIPNPSATFQDNSVNCIVQDLDDPNILWLAANNGLYKFNRQTKKNEKFTFTESSKDNIACMSMMMDQAGELWVGTWGAGMVLFDTKEKTSTFFIPNEKEYYQYKNFETNVINDIDRKNNLELWVCTNDEGLAIFNTKEKKYRYIKNDETNPASLRSNSIKSLYQDRKNTLWIVNESRGISILDPSNQLFQFTEIALKECPNSKSIIITGFAMDETSEKLYISTEGCEGLYIYQWKKEKDSGQNYFEFIKAVNTNINNNQSAYFKNVLVDSKNKVWLTPKIRGQKVALLTYEENEKQCIPFSHSGLEQMNFHSFEINDILESGNQNIWFGTALNGLIKYDRQLDTLIQYVQSDTHPNFMNKNAVIQELKEDSKGRLWIATLQDGIYMFDTAKEKFTHFPAYVGKPFGLNATRVMSIEEDKDGKIWIGLSSLGIQIIDPELPPDQVMKSFNRENGLPDEKIVHIVKDHQGYMWISTNKGLTRYDHEANHFTSYGNKDGIKDPFLLSKKIEVLPNGEILIGQKTGFHYCATKNIYKNEEAPKVVFTNFKIFEQEKIFDRNINFLEEIELKHNENFFTLSFAALSYSKPEKNRYAYMLQGVDKDWIYPTDGRHFAHYTNIREGNYLFKVKAANNDGIWSTQNSELQINILPPWYRTLWSKALFLLIISMVSYIFFQYRLQQALEIERMRTKISSDLHDDVGTLLSGIAMQADILEETISSSHKLRIKRISEQSRNAMSRMRDVVWAFDSRNDKMEDLLDRMKEHTKETIGAKGIDYIFDIKNINIQKKIPVNVRQNLYLIFKEAITNIAKHSNAEKVNIRFNNLGQTFEMCIADNGQVNKKNYKTTGLGLSNIEMRAKRINANLKVDKGNGFTILVKMKSFC